MLIHAGADRTVRVDLALAVWLALAAGAVNAAGFRALGYFSANMTGNVSSMSDELALLRPAAALWFLSLVLAFILGAFVSGLLIEAGRHRLRGIHALSILVEALLLILLTLMDLWWRTDTAEHAMLLGLSAVMGLQNAASTSISDGRVRTTHVSGIATDIGLALATLVGGRARAGTRGAEAVRGRLVLHLCTLVAFFGGGLAGVWGYGVAGPVVYLAVAALLLALALPQLRRTLRPGSASDRG